MKTIFHWKNFAKLAGVVLGVGILVAAVPWPQPLGFFIGLIAGAAAAMWFIERWDMWHFE